MADSKGGKLGRGTSAPFISPPLWINLLLPWEIRYVERIAMILRGYSIRSLVRVHRESPFQKQEILFSTGFHSSRVFLSTELPFRPLFSRPAVFLFSLVRLVRLLFYSVRRDGKLESTKRDDRGNAYSYFTPRGPINLIDPRVIILTFPWSTFFFFFFLNFFYGDWIRKGLFCSMSVIGARATRKMICGLFSIVHF